MNAASLIALIPVHVLGMFLTYLQFAKRFDPKRVNARYRVEERNKRLFERPIDKPSTLS